jgi:FdhE protein
LPDLTTVFLRRAERLSALAPGHELAGFLGMVAALSMAQHQALSVLPPGRLPGSAEIAEAKAAKRAPLDPERWQPADESWRSALSGILAKLDPASLPSQGREAAEALAVAPVSELEAVAKAFLSGEVTSGDAAKAVFVAAALQVAWTRMAALLDVSGLDPADRGTCPACGSPPVAGLIAPGGTKFGHRHLHCSLCATSWRYVRVRCVHCRSTDKITYRQLAGAQYVRAECCENCRGYSKVFYLDSVKIVEPMADDLASLGLDVLVGEEGFSRVANPFILGAMPPAGLP